MRRSIVPGASALCAYNLARGVPNIAMYELGRVLLDIRIRASQMSRKLCNGDIGRPADMEHKYPTYDFFDKGCCWGSLEALQVRFPCS